ncbi:hypothetical protein Tco_0656406 [Tanacetum coccineum]|uniref:Integrase, catalytic region, zinc finger, CCHC-type, peptidase aspartic, catalytic n=1 Tax=Tanacetum coccineum TaxID=301880 RepID=A0ABQ4X8N4_9ASTR
MANLLKDIQCAGSDTRPPMLDRTDFASWQQFIRLYCRDKERHNADIRATNILLQGLPKEIYTLINHYTDAKDIWDNNKGETIHDYYVRFTKLINDMRNIKMTMPIMQLNSKFVNNMLPEWERFVTAVKLNRGLKESNYDHLYAYLKQHEAHANENKMMLEQFTQHIVDPLALMSNVSHQWVDRTEVRGTMHGEQVQLVMGELRTELGMKIRVKQGRLNKMLLMQAQENRVVLDEEQLLFISADDYDAFDSDVDEAPTAHTMFMANLSSAYHVYDEVGLSYDSDILSEVHDHDNYQDAVCEHHEVHEMHDDVQPNCIVDSDADYMGDSNIVFV